MAQEDVPEGSTLTPWAQCDKCLKWRRIPWYVDPEQLPDYWVCADNKWDPERASCDVSQVDPSRKPSRVDVACSLALLLDYSKATFCFWFALLVSYERTDDLM